MSSITPPPTTTSNNNNGTKIFSAISIATTSIAGLYYWFRGSNNNNKNNTRKINAVSDYQALYELCFNTHQENDEEIQSLENHTLLGDREIGSYLQLSPDTCFVLTNEKDKIIGYACAAVDTKRFNARLKQYYLPTLRTAYPYPNENPEDFSLDQQFIHMFHYPDFSIDSTHTGTLKTTKNNQSNYLNDFPSSLQFTIDVAYRDDNNENASVLLKEVLCNLKNEHNSRGVHIEMPPTDEWLIKFLTAHGFIEIVSSSKYTRILGLKF